MLRRSSLRVNLAAGVAFIALCVLAFYLAFGGAVPFQRSFEIDAVFRNANGIRPGSPVRIAGVEVGKVASVRQAPRGADAAVVRMRIEERGRPLRRDAHLKIRPRIFLEGNFFVDLQPGSPSAPELREGETIPIDQTDVPVQISQVTAALTADVRSDLQTALDELAGGLEGEGAAGLHRSIEHWEAAYRGQAVVADALQGTRRGDLSGFIANAGTVAAALDRDPAALQALITDFRTTAGALAREQDALAQTFAELPPLLRTASPALAELDATFPPVRRLVADARPGVRAVTPGLRASLPLTRELAGLLRPTELGGLSRDASAAVPRLAALTRDAVPALREVRLGSGCQTEVVLPLVNDRIEDPAFPATGPVFQELAKALPGIAGESRAHDANGQWVRALFTGGNYAYPQPGGRFLLTSRPIMGANPPKPAGAPPFRPDVACETQEPPDLRTQAADPPAGMRVRGRDPLARELAERGRRAADRRVTRWIRDAGLQDRLRVDGDVLSAADLPRLRRSMP